MQRYVNNIDTELRIKKLYTEERMSIRQISYRI